MTNLSHPILFFDLAISGHHVEFLYHLITYRLSHPKKESFIFVVHPDFVNQLNELGISGDLNSSGIFFVCLLPEEMEQLLLIRSLHKRAKAEFKILQSLVYKYKPKCCYLLALNAFQLAVGGGIGKSLPCSIRGILFNPFGAPGNREPMLVTTFRKQLQMMWMLRNPNLEHIYVLNDDALADSLNKKFNRNNFFVSLPDPIFILEKSSKHNQDSSLFNNSNKFRFLMFGSLSVRKGIFLVLDALRLISNDIIKQIEIVFAGKINILEREIFFSALNQIKYDRPELTIHYLDRFVPYAYIPELFIKSDCIIVPYVGNQSSSGVIGHAALYKRPVIGPDKGLLGKLIREYDLGITIKNMDTKKLADNIINASINKYLLKDTSGMKRFVEERHPNRFTEKLLAK